jgi:hypothetical protein
MQSQFHREGIGAERKRNRAYNSGREEVGVKVIRRMRRCSKE